MGRYVTGDGKQHGWLLSRGVYTQLDFPGATATTAEGISPEGAIVGSYVSADGKLHAYLLSK